MLAEITLHRLRVFCEVVDSCGFKAAAQRLNISQPAVSAHIRGIEEELGIPILEKTREIRLTEVGAVLYNYAKVLLKETDKTSHIICEMRKANIGRVAIGIGHLLVRSGISDFLIDFKKQNLQIELVQRTGNTHNICQMIHDREVDFGLVTSLPDFKEFIVQTMGEDELIIVAGITHPLYGKEDVVTAEEISEYPFILPNRDSKYFRFLEEMLSNRGIIIEKMAIEVDDTYNYKKMVEEGIGLGIVPKLNVIRDIQKGTVHRINMTISQMTFPIYFVYQSDKYFSPAAQKFLKFLLPKVKELYTMNNQINSIIEGIA